MAVTGKDEDAAGSLFDAVDARMDAYDPNRREKLGRSHHIEDFIDAGLIDPDDVGYVEDRSGQMTGRIYYDPSDHEAFRSAKEVEDYLAESHRVLMEEYVRWSDSLR